MRISADPKSPYYIPEAVTAKVMLNGEELIGCCITADDKLGECECLIDPKHSIETEIRHGKVEIILADE